MIAKPIDRTVLLKAVFDACDLPRCERATNLCTGCRRLVRETLCNQGMDDMPLVLIIEDNPINRDILGRRLERRGYSVRFAEDGPTGVEAAARLAPTSS